MTGPAELDPLKRSKRRRAARWLRGDGIEVGGLNNPLELPPGARAVYVDRASDEELREAYPELAESPLVHVAVIGDAEDLSGFDDEAVDFVIGNHLLEHLENPIRGLQEMTRVLKPGGVLFMALPDPRATFDRDRPRTSVDHVIAEYRNGTSDSRRGHYAEWVELAEPHVDFAARLATDREREARVEQLMAARHSIHFHVWLPGDFAEVLAAARRLADLRLEPLEFIPCVATGDDEYIFVLSKGDRLPAPADLELPVERDARRMTEQVGDLEAALAATRADLESLRAHLNAVETSRSWRLTEPVRKGSRALHVLAGRVKSQAASARSRES